MDGRLSQKSISKAFPVNISLQIAEFIMLAAIGALGVLLHAYFRIPLRFPGHHGFIYMGLLISGRLLSNKKYASSLSAIGSACMLLFPLGFKDPFIPVIYLFPGFIVDIFYARLKSLQPKIIILALICGLAYTIIPFTRIFITLVTGFPYGSLLRACLTAKQGFIYPLVMHFIFGFSGGLAASGVFSLFRKKKIA